MEFDLATLLSGALMKKNVLDVLLWGKEVPGTFTVNSTYESLAKQSSGTQYEVFVLLWKAKTFPNMVTKA